MLKNEERLKQPISSSPRDGGGWGMGVWVGTQQLFSDAPSSSDFCLLQCGLSMGQSPSG